MKNLLAYHGFYVIEPEFDYLGINTLCINVTYFKKIQKLSSLKIEYFSYVRVSINSKSQCIKMRHVNNLYITNIL